MERALFSPRVSGLTPQSPGVIVPLPTPMLLLLTLWWVRLVSVERFRLPSRLVRQTRFLLPMASLMRPLGKLVSRFLPNIWLNLVRVLLLVLVLRQALYRLWFRVCPSLQGLVELLVRVVLTPLILVGASESVR